MDHDGLQDYSSFEIGQEIGEGGPDFWRLTLDEDIDVVDHEALLEALHSNTTFRHVSISYQFLHNFVIAGSNKEPYIRDSIAMQLWEAIATLPQLACLEIEESFDDAFIMPIHVLTFVLQRATRLEELTCCFVELIVQGGEHYEAQQRDLLSALASHQCLREVTMTRTRLDPRLSLDCIIASLSKLEILKLHVAGRRSTPVSLSPLFGSKTLVAMEISNVYIYDGVPLSEALSLNESLQKLHLEFLDLTSIGWKAFGGVLRRNQSVLESLTFRNLGIQDDAFIAVAEGLQSNTSVRELRLFNVELSEKSWLALPRMLERNQHLTRLSLENCDGIRDIVGVAMAQSLAQNRTLKQLRVVFKVVGDYLGRSSQEAFLDLLRSSNTVLDDLHILPYTHDSFDNEISELESELEFYLTLNRFKLRSLCLHDNVTPSSFLNILEEHGHDLSILHFLISRNPSILCQSALLTCSEKDERLQ